MKILVIGAGGQGGLMAAKLLKGGHDVTLMARGKRLEELRQNGLVLKHWISGDVFHYNPKITGTLEPADEYDLVVPVMGKHHQLALLPLLQQAHKIPTVLFTGNNALGSVEFTEALGPDRVLLGFLMAVGSFEDGQAVFLDEADDKGTGIILGETDGSIGPRLLEISAALEAAHFDVTISRDIQSWLKTHASIIVPLACSLYLVNGGPVDVADTPDAVLTLVRGIREALAVQKRLGIKVDPWKFRAIASLPEPLLVSFLAKLLRNPNMKYAVGHAGSIRPEMAQLAGEMRLDILRSELNTPNLDLLFSTLDPDCTPIPHGSRKLKPHTSEFIPWVGVPLLITIGLARLVRRFRSRE